MPIDPRDITLNDMIDAARLKRDRAWWRCDEELLVAWISILHRLTDTMALYPEIDKKC